MGQEKCRLICLGISSKFQICGVADEKTWKFIALWCCKGPFFFVITCLVNIGRCILGSKKSKLTNRFLVPEHHFYYQSFQFKICQRHYWISYCASHILIHFTCWYSGFLQSKFKTKAPETYVGSTSQNDEWNHGPAANSFFGSLQNCTQCCQRNVG